MESFLSHSAEKFGRGTNLLCCVSESFWQRECFEKEVEGVLKVSVERVLSHSAEKFGRGTTLPICAVFHRNSGSEKVFKMRGKDYQEFQSKVFCLSVPKILVGEQPFCAVFQKNSGSEKNLEKKGEYQEFPWKVFCRTVATNLLGEQPFCAVFQRNSGSENVLKKRGKEF